LDLKFFEGSCKIGGNKLKCQSKNVEQQRYFSSNHRALGNVYEAGSFFVQQFITNLLLRSIKKY